MEQTSDKRIVFALIALGVCARLVPHPWNFTPIGAMALYAGARLPKLYMSAVTTVAALLISDAFLGFYSGMWYVYGASLIPVLLGAFVQGRRLGIAALLPATLLSGFSFFVVTNAAVWATGHLYPRTLSGLATCFTAAIPFYQNQVAGDLFYTAALFGADMLFRRLVLSEAKGV
jgi:hypothetical protein